jgi:hypothetical protein
VPTSQASHEVARACEYLPFSQMEQEMEFLVEYVPASQAVHVVAPMEEPVAKPPEQFKQESMLNGV